MQAAQHRAGAQDRIYEVFPLVCPTCGGAMRIIAFITAAPTVRDMLVHLGEPTAPPRIAPARGPPLWETPGAEHELTPDPALPPTPAYAFDQRPRQSTTTYPVAQCDTGRMGAMKAKSPASESWLVLRECLK